jgi:hypothetical protein
VLACETLRVKTVVYDQCRNDGEQLQGAARE